MKVKRPCKSYQDKLFPVYLQKSLNDLRKAGLSCDVVLAMHNKEWSAHKTVLAAASPYFCAMFNSQFREAKSNRVVFRNIDSESITAILDFIYSSRVKLNRSNVFPLMDATNYFQVNPIKLWINNYLQVNVTVENCVGLYERSRNLSYHDLANTALVFIRKNFVRVVEQGEFLQASGELLTTLLDSNFLNVESEDFLIKIIMKWINANKRQRCHYAVDLLNKIELRNIPLQKLTSLRLETIFREDAELAEFLEQKIQEWKTTTPAERSVRWRTVRYASEKEVIFAIGGIADEIPIRCVECFTFVNASWKKSVPQYVHSVKGLKNMIQVPGMNLARTNAAVAYDAYNVYVLGGKSVISHLSECEYYNIKANAWTNMTPLPVRLEGGTAVFFEGRLTFIGGQNQSGYSGAVWQWDDVHGPGKWKSLPSLNVPRAFHCAISYGGYIYVMGGFTSENNTALRSVERYDPLKQKWFEIQSMHKARGKFGCALVNNCIYVMGGVDKRCFLRSVEKYVLETNTWSCMSPMFSPRTEFSAVVYENKIFAIGGTDGRHYLRRVDRYNPLTNRWGYIFSVRTPRIGLVTAVLYVPYITQEELAQCQNSSLLPAGTPSNTQ